MCTVKETCPTARSGDLCGTGQCKGRLSEDVKWFYRDSRIDLSKKLSPFTMVHFTERETEAAWKLADLNQKQHTPVCHQGVNPIRGFYK